VGAIKLRKLPETIDHREFLELIKGIRYNDTKKIKKIKTAFVLGFYQCMRISEVAGLKEEVSKCCRSKVVKKVNGKMTRFCSKCDKELKLLDISRGKEWKILPLKSENVDINRGFIHIIAGKGQKDRDVPIQKPVFPFLKHLPIGLSARTINRELSRWSNKILGKKLSFHDLRHSGSSFYLNEMKVDIRHLQILLGHESIATTQRYTHVTPKGLKDVFDDLWGGV